MQQKAALIYISLFFETGVNFCEYKNTMFLQTRFFEIEFIFAESLKFKPQALVVYF